MQIRAALAVVIAATILCSCSSPPTGLPPSSPVIQASVVAKQVQDVLSAGETSLDHVPASSKPCSSHCSFETWPVADLIPIMRKVADQLQVIRYPLADERDATSLVTDLRKLAANAQGPSRESTSSLIDDAAYRTALTRLVRQLHLPATDASFDPAVMSVETGTQGLAGPTVVVHGPP